MLLHRYDDSRQFLVLQTDHGRVAGLLAAQWGNDVFAEPKPYPSVVLAAQEHDCGWWNWEIKPTLNVEGYAPDYQRFWMGTAGVTEGSEGRAQAWLDFYRDGIDWVCRQDPYAGLLVLMHGTGLLSQGYGVRTNLPDMRGEPIAQDFLRDRDTLRDKLREELRQSDEFRAFSSDEHVWRNFRLLEVYDQVSQFLCNRYPLNSVSRQTGPRNVIGNVPVGPDKDDGTLTIDVQDERRAVIRPYPFASSPLEVSFPARVMPNRPYTSRDDFLRDFYAAQHLTVTYTLHKP